MIHHQCSLGISHYWICSHLQSSSQSKGSLNWKTLHHSVLDNCGHDHDIRNFRNLNGAPPPTKDWTWFVSQDGNYWTCYAFLLIASSFEEWRRALIILSFLFTMNIFELSLVGILDSATFRIIPHFDMTCYQSVLTYDESCALNVLHSWFVLSDANDGSLLLPSLTLYAWT